MNGKNESSPVVQFTLSFFVLLLDVDFGVSLVFPLRRMLVMLSDGENGNRCRRDPKNNTGDESGSWEVGNDGAKGFRDGSYEGERGSGARRI
jgi:hypothetical protein